jgi:hypothetical protein
MMGLMNTIAVASLMLTLPLWENLTLSVPVIMDILGTAPLLNASVLWE